ncbi:MAG: VOC family protein [Cytophagales bacterium]|nr:MAG: VOC family protein [Cytophagales bacterium]
MPNQLYTCLWFDGNAKDAADYYCRIFENGKILMENSTVIILEINKTKLMALNGGAQYQLSPAASLVIECDTQTEIDYYWEQLGKGGIYSRCGWLTDRFGVSWQIIPSVLPQLMADPEKAPKVAQVFVHMTKFEIAPLLEV